MEMDRNMPTYEELYHQQQQELMLQLQPVSSVSEAPTYHPSYYTQDVQQFLVEKSHHIGSHLIH
ncbi:hypothetical protein [Candidatus Albibeggiatoa sp. nov. NOAA]|uniref:hypothetical protein n=1 Tax=Candidatus Albibeggiatoa sp. nov. NOAA TaxID=3162724 RepID=UPI0033045E58|nr:hypothetical protein [Thiotrichaceae bacterium]